MASYKLQSVGGIKLQVTGHEIDSRETQERTRMDGLETGRMAAIGSVRGAGVVRRADGTRYRVSVQTRMDVQGEDIGRKKEIEVRL